MATSCNVIRYTGCGNQGSGVDGRVGRFRDNLDSYRDLAVSLVPPLMALGDLLADAVFAIV